MEVLAGTGVDEESTSLALSLASLTEADFSRLRVCYEVPGCPGEPLVSATQLIAVATGEAGCAFQTWRNIRNFLNTSGDRIAHIYGQQGRHSSEMVDVLTALRIILKLPGRAAAHWRVRASVLLTRSLGRDVMLVGEVYGLNELQNYLRQHHPEHPLATFHEAVEPRQTSTAFSQQAAEELDLERQAKRARLLREIAADNEEAARSNERRARARDIVSTDIAARCVALYNQVQAMGDLDDRERAALQARLTTSMLTV